MQFQKETNETHINIKGYRPGEINISGKTITHPVFITPETVEEFHCLKFELLDVEQVEKLISKETEVLLIGTGKDHKILSAKFIRYFNDKGIAIEAMSTRAACHTFQVLVHERRKVAGVLFN